MNVPRPRTIRQALGWLLASVALPLLAGALALVVLHVFEDTRLSQQRLRALAQTLLVAVDAELARGQAQAEVLAASPTIDARDWVATRRFAAEVTSKVPGSLMVLVDHTGQVLFNTAVPVGSPLPNLWEIGTGQREVQWEGRTLALSSQNLSRQAFEQRKVVYSDLYYGVQIHRPALALSIPVMRGGEPRYALIMSFPPSLLQELLNGSIAVPNVRAAVIDRTGKVVAANAASKARLADQVSQFTSQGTAEGGLYQGRSRDGVDMRGGYAVSERNGYTVLVGQPALEHVLSLHGTWLAWVALAAAAVGAGLLLAGVATRRLTKPLLDLSHDALAGRAPPASRTSGIAEIDALAQALRDGVQADRQRQEEQTLRRIAQERADELRRADALKDEFLAVLSHELRNPLAPILTSVELMARRGLPDPASERARAIIERQARHLAHLVDDLLDVSRVSLGRIQLRPERVDLGAIAAAAVEAIRGALEASGLELAQEIAQPAPAVRGDATRLTQCLLNLLNNAVKFTPAGGRITLRVATEGERAVITVRDTGRGIAPENLERIFQMFVQETSSGLDGNSGLGVGLGLTRKLVELHGGSVHATSEGAGRGSSFRIELPLAAAEPPVPSAQPAAAGLRPAQVRILAVDDNRDAADALCSMLDVLGFACTTAYDGKSALEAYERHRPDAVLLDIGLPDTNGYEVCRRIRALHAAGEGRARPVLLALTGWGQAKDQQAAQEAGFDGHLTKPATSAAVLEELGRHLGGRAPAG